MKTHVVYYHEYSGDSNDAILNSPFSIEGIGFGLNSDYSVSPKDTIYSQCPAWKHKANRIFTVKSPVDIDCFVDRNEKSIHSKFLTQEQFDEWFSPTFGDNSWCSSERTTIQLAIPRFIFWTESKNIWIEQRSHPLTSLNNNFITVGGWFNISNWCRSTGFAFDIVDWNLPVTIKRGDPISQIAFYSDNLDDGFILKRKEPSEEVLHRVRRTTGVVNTFRKIPQDIINKIFLKEESKCPFHYFWKK